MGGLERFLESSESRWLERYLTSMMRLDFDFDDSVSEEDLMETNFH